MNEKTTIYQFEDVFLSKKCPLFFFQAPSCSCWKTHFFLFTPARFSSQNVPCFSSRSSSHILFLMKHPWTTIPLAHPPTFYSHIFLSSSQNPHFLKTSIPFLCFSLNPLSPTTARFLVLQASNSFIAHPSASLHPQPPPWQGGHLFCSTCPCSSFI